MAGTLTSITRFPVKGLSGESLECIELEPGHGLPHDRRYALALADTEFDEQHPLPLPKTKFVVLMRYERLAALTAEFDAATSQLVLRCGSALLANARLDEAEGRNAIASVVADFIGERLQGRPRVVAAAGHRFTDVGTHSPSMMEAVSVVNLASVRALEQAMGEAIDPRRFRANLLVDGLEPWAEFGWMDREITIGELRFRGMARTRRCAATEVNPDTATRDLKIPAAIVKHFGHADMGVYVSAQTRGSLRLGAPLPA